MKKILALVAIIVSLLCGCQSTPPSPESVSISAVYAFNMTTLDNSTSPSAIVAKLKSVSLIGCPKDFIDAYDKYVSAWAGFAQLEKKMYAQDLKKADADFAAFINLYQSNPSEATVRLKQDWKSLAGEIDVASGELSRSFANLKVIGAKYDVPYAPRAWYSM